MKMVAYKPFENTDDGRQNSFVTIDLNKNNIKVDRNQMLTMKKAVVFGTLQIICAVCVTLISGSDSNVLFFGCMVGVCGSVTILAGMYQSKLYLLIVMLLSFLSMVASIQLLIQSREWIRQDVAKYSVLIVSSLLSIALSISSLVMASNDGGCCGCKVSPNENIIYFKRHLRLERPQFMMEANLKPTSFGPYHQETNRSDDIKYKNDEFAKYLGHLEGPSNPPYLDAESSNSSQNTAIILQ